MGAISSLRTTSVGAAKIGGDYVSIRRELGCPPDTETLPTSGECRELRLFGSPPSRIEEFPNIDALRNAMRAFRMIAKAGCFRGAEL